MDNIKKLFSLKTKMYIFVVLTVITVSFGTSLVAFRTSADHIDRYYKQCAKDNAKNFASMVDGDYLATLRDYAQTSEFQDLRERAEAEDNEYLIEEYLSDHNLWEDYCRIRSDITKYLNNMESVKYLYLVAVGDENATTDMYLVDDESFGLYETGYYEEREQELLGIDLRQEQEPTISNGDWGWLCSAFYPVYDSKGEFVCDVGCDFAMDQVMQERHQMFVYLIIGAAVLTLVVLTGAMLFINKFVVMPIDAMTKEMKKFDPSEHKSYEDAGVMELEIESHDEIKEIYSGIRSMQMNIIDYLKDLSVLTEDKLKAEKAIEGKEKQIDILNEEVLRDALTGVGSKAAYSKKAEEINEALSKGNCEFAVVMVDMNDLKDINDEFGHKCGDLYIKGCCSMVCEAFKHSPVFRVGGDEFIVIVQGVDYTNRMKIFEKLKADFEKTYSDTEVNGWERYSAAIGMSENYFDDVTVDLVFKRADKAMYEDKQRFKKAHGGNMR